MSIAKIEVGSRIKVPNTATHKADIGTVVAFLTRNDVSYVEYKSDRGGGTRFRKAEEAKIILKPKIKGR
jgi:hypothetical protein